MKGDGKAGKAAGPPPNVKAAAPRLHDWHAIAILGAAVAFFFRDIIAQRAFFWEDFITQAYPFRAFASVSLANGELPLWNPYTFAGMPFQADIQSAVFYIPNLLLVPFVRDGYLPFYIFELSVVAHYWIAGTTMYYLAKEVGLDPVYALFSGLMFALSGFLIVQALHPGFVQQLAWFPLIFLLFHRALLRRSAAHSVGAGLVTGLSLLAGAPQITLFLFLLLALYFGFHVLMKPLSVSGVRERLSLLAVSALMVVTALGVAAIQLLPTIELQPLSERASMTFEQAQHARLELQQLITAVVPRFFGSTSATGDTFWGAGGYGAFWESCFYVGIPGLLLIHFALPLMRSVPVVRFLFGAALLAFLLALGNQFFLHRLFFDYVPGFNTFRGIGRATLLATFAGSLLGGFGLRAVVDASRSDNRRLQLSLVAAAAVMAMLWLLLRFRLLFPGSDQLDNPAVLAGAIHQATAALVFMILLVTTLLLFARGIVSRRALISALFLIQFADMHSFGFTQNNGDLNGMTYFTRHEDLLLRTLKQDSRNELFRISARTGSALLLDRNHGMVERIFLTDGYTPLKLMRVQPPAFTHDRSYDLLNTKYRAAVDAETRATVMTISENHLPRAFVVHDAAVARSPREVEELMISESFDPRRTVVLERPVALQQPDALAADTTATAPESRAIVTSYGINRIALDVDMRRNGVLVLSEIFYPGWIATVDGDPAPVLRANWSMRAVPLPAGSHRVDVMFVPAPFFRGALITAVTLFLAAGHLAWYRFRRRGELELHGQKAH